MPRNNEKFAVQIIEITDAIKEKDRMVTDILVDGRGFMENLKLEYFSGQLGELRGACQAQVNGGIFASLGITNIIKPYLEKIIDACNREITHVNLMDQGIGFQEIFSRENVKKLKSLNDKLIKSLTEAGKFMNKLPENEKAVLTQEGVSSALNVLAKELGNQIKKVSIVK